MRRLVPVLAALLLASPAAADMYQDASNANLPEARLNLHAQPSLDARDFGMKCDGTTDDKAAFQAALDAAQTRGAAVTISAQGNAPSVCTLASAVDVRPGVGIWAQPGTIALKPTPGNAGSPMLLGLYVNNHVYGLTIDGGGSDHPNGANVSQAYNSNNVVFDTVKFQNTRGIAFLASTAIKNSGVRNSIFVNIGNHWRTTHVTTDRQQAVAFCCGASADSYGNFVVNNSFTDIGLDPTSVGAQKDFMFADNKCDMEQGQLAVFPGGPAFGGCFYSVDSDTATVIGNRIDGAAGNGIDIMNTKYLVVAGNQVTRSGNCGIGVFGATSATVTGNISRNNGQWATADSIDGSAGICLSNSANGGRVSIAGNVATDDQATKTQLYGVRVSAPSTFQDLRIGQDNALSGNIAAALKGAAAYAGPGPVTVSALPACTAALKHSTMAVSDQSGVPTYRGALTGGGSLSVLAYCNGTAWEAH